MTNNFKRGFTDAISTMQKQAALSWRPWRWGKNNAETGNKYNWGDLWTGLGAAGAQTMKAMSRAGHDLARGASSLLGQSDWVDKINKSEKYTDNFWNEHTPGGQDSVNTFEYDPGARQALRATELIGATLPGAVAGPYGLLATTAATKAGTRPDTGVKSISWDENGRPVPELVNADPAYKAWDNATGFMPYTWVGNLTGEVNNEMADSNSDKYSAGNVVGAGATGLTMGAIDRALRYAGRKWPALTAAGATLAGAGTGAWRAKPFLREWNENLDTLRGDAETARPDVLLHRTNPQR